MKQPILHQCFAYIDTIGQNKRPLKLSGCDAAMKEYSILATFNLPSANDKLSILNGYRQILFRQSFWPLNRRPIAQIWGVDTPDARAMPLKGKCVYSQS